MRLSDPIKQAAVRVLQAAEECETLPTKLTDSLDRLRESVVTAADTFDRQVLHFLVWVHQAGAVRLAYLPPCCTSEQAAELRRFALSLRLVEFNADGMLCVTATGRWWAGIDA